MGRLGRDPEFFRYVEGSVAERILERVEYALTVPASPLESLYRVHSRRPLSPSAPPTTSSPEVWPSCGAISTA